MRHKRDDSRRLYATPPVIKLLMGLKGVKSARALGVKAGVAKDVAHRFTSGLMVDTSVEHAEKLAAALGVRVTVLFVERRNTLSMEDLAA